VPELRGDDVEIAHVPDGHFQVDKFIGLLGSDDGVLAVVAHVGEMLDLVQHEIVAFAVGYAAYP